MKILGVGHLHYVHKTRDIDIRTQRRCIDRWLDGHAGSRWIILATRPEHTCAVLQVGSGEVISFPPFGHARWGYVEARLATLKEEIIQIDWSKSEHGIVWKISQTNTRVICACK